MRALCFQHIDCEGPGLLGEFLAQRGVALHTVHLDHGDPIPDPREYDALLVLGGPMNVYEEDRHPFLRAEDRAIRRALAAGVPYLGFCLGSQLLAKALGAPVTQNPVKEIGFFEVALTPEGLRDPLLAGLPDPLPVFQWHGDTFAIPAGAVHLASSPVCRNQAFRHGRVAYGLQFHVEVTRAMVAEWLEAYAEEAALTPGVQTARIFGEADAWLGRMRGAAERMFANFLDLARARAASPSGR
jgi:GMP synthase-like glutamine amidotransferase